MHIHAYAQTSIHTRAHTHMHIYCKFQWWLNSGWLSVCDGAYSCACTYLPVFIHTCMHVCTYMHTCMSSYTHTGMNLLNIDLTKFYIYTLHKLVLVYTCMYVSAADCLFRRPGDELMQVDNVQITAQENLSDVRMLILGQPGMHAFIHIHVCTHTHGQPTMHAFIHIHVCMHTHVYIITCSSWASQVCIHTHTCIARTYMYTS